MRLVRCTVLVYRRWRTRSTTATTAVFSMAADTTIPSRTFRGLGRAPCSPLTGALSPLWGPLGPWSAIALLLCCRRGLAAGGHASRAGVLGGLPFGVGLGLCRLGGDDLVAPEQRLDAGDVLAELAQAAVVVELAGDVLEGQVEQLL